MAGKKKSSLARSKACNSYCTRFASWILVAVNVCPMVAGAACVGLWIYSTTGSLDILGPVGSFLNVEDALDAQMDKTSFITRFLDAIFAFGIIMFAMGFLGFYGAWKQKVNVLIVYAVLCLLLFALISVLLVALICFKNTFDATVEDALAHTLREDYIGTPLTSTGAVMKTNDTISNIWDMVMTQLECCGNRGRTDFQRAAKWNAVYTFTYNNTHMTTTALVPIACCKMDNPKNFIDDIDNVVFLNLHDCLSMAHPSFTHHQGCYPKINDLMNKHKDYVYIAVSVMGAFILLLVACTIHLIMCIKAEAEGDEDSIESPGMEDLLDILENIPCCV